MKNINQSNDPFDLRAAFEEPAVSGMPRGTNTEGDVLTQTVDGRSLNDIWREFQSALQLQNSRRQTLVDLLTFSVQNPVEDIPVISTDDFEEASEFGEPKGIRGGDYVSAGYDFKWYDLAIRYTWKYLAEATAAQVESLNNLALEADNRLVFTKVLRAIFNSANRSTDIRQTAINVYPFYNGDGTIPPAYKNSTFAGTHSHYLVSGAATIDSGDLSDIEEQLKHHGYGKQAGGTLIVLMNSAQLAVVRTFRVSSGAAYDFVPAQGQAPFLLPTNTGGIQGGQPPANYQGMNVAGQYGPLLIIEEDYIPAGYVLAFSTGGESQAVNPVGIREHANSGLRGLRLVKGRDNDYPLVDSFYNRGFGTGVRHRGAGVVLQIKATGTYDIPAAYV